MSGHGVYQHPGHYGRLPESQYGIASNMYANVNVNYDIPDQSGYVSGLNGTSPLQPSRGFELQFNQKLDRLLELMNNQKEETTKLHSEVSKLKEDVVELRTTKASTSPELTLPTKRLPLELSVRVISVFCAFCVLLWVRYNNSANLYWLCL